MMCKGPAVNSGVYEGFLKPLPATEKLKVQNISMQFIMFDNLQFNKLLHNVMSPDG